MTAREYVFGSGQMFLTPVGGGAPTRFGTLQDVSVEFDGDVKELFGQYGFPVAVGRGKQKVMVKAGNADLDLALYNATYFGDSAVATGGYSQALNEMQTVPAMSTYTITVTNAAHFYLDLGVVDAAGNTYTQVASGPTGFQYSVNTTTGVYTFPSTAASVVVYINYLYTVTTGHTLTMTNQLIGTQPHFALLLSETYNGNWFIMKLNSVICSKLTMPLKLDDFSIQDIEMSPQVDATNTLGWISTSY